MCCRGAPGQCILIPGALEKLGEFLKQNSAMGLDFEILRILALLFATLDEWALLQPWSLAVL